MADLLEKMEDCVGNRSGIRCCGLLFCWVLLEDPAPLSRLIVIATRSIVFRLKVGPGSARFAFGG